MNYEFHVGDYVETIGGFVGWISNIKDNNYIVIVDKNNNSCGYYLPQEDRYFVRIGAYDFTKKEKKKIEMISECNRGIFANTIKPENHLARMVSNEIIDKINELVDAMNLLLDKSTES
nr:MAG TPA: Preprotein translocase subunit [Caudoviricetes sp.]